jgi:hypothetical protein
MITNGSAVGQLPLGVDVGIGAVFITDTVTGAESAVAPFSSVDVTRSTWGPSANPLVFQSNAHAPAKISEPRF